MSIGLYITSCEFSGEGYTCHVYQKEKYLHYYGSRMIRLGIGLKQALLLNFGDAIDQINLRMLNVTLQNV